MLFFPASYLRVPYIRFIGRSDMSLAPTNYDFGVAANYAFVNDITCNNEEARKMYVEAFGHMLNYNHEQAIGCFTNCTELDPE